MVFLSTLLFTLITYYTNKTLNIYVKNNDYEDDLYDKTYALNHKLNILKYKNYI
jgi:hypothetical protein